MLRTIFLQFKLIQNYLRSHLPLLNQFILQEKKTLSPGKNLARYQFKADCRPPPFPHPFSPSSIPRPPPPSSTPSPILPYSTLFTLFDFHSSDFSFPLSHAFYPYSLSLFHSPLSPSSFPVPFFPVHSVFSPSSFSVCGFGLSQLLAQVSA